MAHPKQPLSPPNPLPAPRNPWDQQPGEPNRWYGRFQVFLSLGPGRSLRQTAAHLPPHPDGSRTHTCGDWGRYAAAWYWYERAAAWDEHQRNLFALSEHNLRRGRHHRRVAIIEDTLESIRSLFRAANLEAVDQDTARGWLPQIRIFLRDMLAADREEFAHDFTAADPAAALPITADDLRAAQRAMEAADALAAPDAQVPALIEPRADALAALKRRHAQRKQYNFLVCTAPGVDPLLDLSALRALKAATGLSFARLLHGNAHALNEALRRQRGFGCPIEYLHLGVPASARGLELAGGPVSADWLRARLDGVRVLLLGNCDSDSIGGWQGVAPYVITLSDSLPREDAAVFAQHFWHAIGLGEDPAAALDAALARCAPAAAQFVLRCW